MMSNWCEPWRNVTPPPSAISSSSGRRGRYIQSVKFQVWIMRTRPSRPLATISRIAWIGRS